MILEKGDMWSIIGVTDWFLITTNPIVNKQGLAVMGRGIAKQAADKFPTLRKDFADKLVNRDGRRVNLSPVFTIGRYEVRSSPLNYLLRVGCFMVKDHWKNRASLQLIESSTDKLLDVIETIDALHNEPKRIDLNFPGIGNGGLAREDVLPIISRLPDNVHVWEYT